MTVQTFQRILIVVAVALIGGLGWWAWGLRAENQVRKANEGLLKAASNRNYKKMRTYLAAEYKDQWGMEGEVMVQSASNVLSQFFVVEIAPTTEPQVTITGDQAQWVAPLRIDGKGTAIAEAVVEHSAETLKGPFTFTWKKQSWKPWDWKLISTSQPELNFNPSWSL
jgi:hypothetical protein